MDLLLDPAQLDDARREYEEAWARPVTGVHNIGEKDETVTFDQPVPMSQLFSPDPPYIAPILDRGFRHDMGVQHERDLAAAFAHLVKADAGIRNAERQWRASVRVVKAWKQSAIALSVMAGVFLVPLIWNATLIAVVRMARKYVAYVGRESRGTHG